MEPALTGFTGGVTSRILSGYIKEPGRSVWYAVKKSNEFWLGSGEPISVRIASQNPKDNSFQ